MKLIFAVDAIFPPLTGIGRYAWELACRLESCPGVQSALFFSHGRFVANSTLQGLGDDGIGVQTDRSSLSARLRLKLASYESVVRLYGLVTPQLFRWRLRGFEDHLFHSPNYFLPLFGGPCVATVHDLSCLLFPDFHPAARVGFVNAQLPRTLARATHLITDSEFVRQQVIAQFGWPASKVSAIGLGVDARFHPRGNNETRLVLDSYGLEHGRYLLCVATIEPRKNIDRLMDAYFELPVRLQERFPLVLVGSPGWNSERLHQRIEARRGLVLRYLRFVPQAHLYALYAGARAFALPSMYEGFGLPVLEAMASGCPCLVSSGSGLEEVGGAAALHVNPLDVGDICRGLTRILEDEAWRDRAVRLGLDAAQKLTWERCFEETLRLYDRLQPVSSP